MFGGYLPPGAEMEMTDFSLPKPNDPANLSLEMDFGESLLLEDGDEAQHRRSVSDPLDLVSTAKRAAELEPQSKRRPSSAASEPHSKRSDVAMWAQEEDLLIVQMVKRLGKRWSQIASLLPGRSDNGVRNRWNRLEKAQAIRSVRGVDHGYRCRRCGQPKRGHICTALSIKSGAGGGAVKGEQLSGEVAQLGAPLAGEGKGAEVWDGGPAAAHRRAAMPVLGASMMAANIPPAMPAVGPVRSWSPGSEWSTASDGISSISSGGLPPMSGGLPSSTLSIPVARPDNGGGAVASPPLDSRGVKVEEDGAQSTPFAFPTASSVFAAPAATPPPAAATTLAAAAAASSSATAGGRAASMAETAGLVETDSLGLGFALATPGMRQLLSGGQEAAGGVAASGLDSMDANDLYAELAHFGDEKPPPKQASALRAPGASSIEIAQPAEQKARYPTGNLPTVNATFATDFASLPSLPTATATPFLGQPSIPPLEPKEGVLPVLAAPPSQQPGGRVAQPGGALPASLPPALALQQQVIAAQHAQQMAQLASLHANEKANLLLRQQQQQKAQQQAQAQQTQQWLAAQQASAREAAASQPARISKPAGAEPLGGEGGGLFAIDEEMADAPAAAASSVAAPTGAAGEAANGSASVIATLGGQAEAGLEAIASELGGHVDAWWS